MSYQAHVHCGNTMDYLHLHAAVEIQNLQRGGGCHDHGPAYALYSTSNARAENRW